jgi:thiamine biosynthesis protein ThiS
VSEIRIIANGLEEKIPDGMTIECFLEIMQEPVRPDMIVEINRKFIHLKEYGNKIINEGDNIEIIGLDIGG